MMDVVRCQEGKEDMRRKIGNVRRMINRGNYVRDRVLAELDLLDKAILEGDWGGYYSVRRPLIAELDQLRERVGEGVPEREESVWEAPARSNNIMSKSDFYGQSYDFERISTREAERENLNRTMPARAVSQRMGNIDLAQSMPAFSRAHSTLHVQPPRSAPKLVLLGHGSYSSPNCSICLDRFSPGEDNKYTLCGHKFHGPCIRTWARTKSRGSRTATCPLCGKNIMQQGTAQLKKAQLPPQIREENEQKEEKKAADEEKEEKKQEDSKPVVVEENPPQPPSEQKDEPKKAAGSGLARLFSGRAAFFRSERKCQASIESQQDIKHEGTTQLEVKSGDELESKTDCKSTDAEKGGKNKEL